ncbi:MAG: hypothetical protein ACLSAO_05650 [Anaerovoracaceae bacterium]
MDKNALTEQRRETVIGLLKGMNIKKASEDGFDKDDVYDCMQQLCDLYEKNIEDLENAYEGEIVSLKDKYQKYDDNNELYVSLIMEAKKSSNEIINQAKSEVESILAEGREQVSIQENELEQMRVGIDAEKQAISDELNAARQAVEAEKAAMRAELEAEKEKLSALKNKYNQQINAMEEEFNEIKTNILRTAGKMDSLKSKLPEEDSINWDVVEHSGIVDFPAEEIEVENTIETPVPDITPAAAAENMSVSEESPEVKEDAATYDAEVSDRAEETNFTLEELTAKPEETASAEAVDISDIHEINLDNIDIDLPELSSSESENTEKTDEISFEGLEELFKEDAK